MKRTSKDVSMTPTHKGSFGKIKFNAMAEPKSSARSVEIMAISAGELVRFEKIKIKKKQIHT
jgi:hypothetical protein